MLLLSRSLFESLNEKGFRQTRLVTRTSIDKATPTYGHIGIHLVENLLVIVSLSILGGGWGDAPTRYQTCCAYPELLKVSLLVSRDYKPARGRCTLVSDKDIAIY